MNRRSLIFSILSTGVLSFFCKNIFTSKNLIYCNIEDFWDTFKYEDERDEKGQEQRNIYRIEDYPICSVFERIKFRRLKKGDHFIMITHKEEYMGPNSGYGFVSRADTDPFYSGGTYGVKAVNINIEQCWTEKAFEKHMILSGIEYHSPSGHYKGGVRIGS